MNIKVLGPGCPKCQQAEKVVRDAVDEAGGTASVDKVTDIMEIAGYGVFATPAVVVEDSGPGLSAEARANLFTPFYSSKETGQGVGLTLSREILTRHGFDFGLESPKDGPTRFWIAFDQREGQA